MANYAIAANQVAAHALALAANVQDVVTFTGRTVDKATLLIHPGGPGPVYFTYDGSTATVGGANCHVVFPGNAVEIDTGDAGQLAGLRGAGASAATAIRLISASAATYSVEA